MAFRGESAVVKAGVRGILRSEMDGQGTETPELFPNTADVLSDLARAKAVFQLRTIALVIGAPPPSAEITRLQGVSL